MKSASQSSKLRIESMKKAQGDLVNTFHHKDYVTGTGMLIMCASLQVPWDAQAADFKAAVESLSNVEEVEVTKDQWTDDTGYDYFRWTVRTGGPTVMLNAALYPPYHHVTFSQEICVQIYFLGMRGSSVSACGLFSLPQSSPLTSDVADDTSEDVYGALRRYGVRCSRSNNRVHPQTPSQDQECHMFCSYSLIHEFGFIHSRN